MAERAVPVPRFPPLPSPILPAELNQPFKPCRRGLYCWRLILVSSTQRVTPQSVHTYPGASLSGWLHLLPFRPPAYWANQAQPYLSSESYHVITFELGSTHAPRKTYFYGNAAIHMPFLIFARSKSITANVLTAFRAG